MVIVMRRAGLCAGAEPTFAGGTRVDGFGELRVPIKGVAGGSHAVIAVACSGKTAGDVSGVGGNEVGNAPLVDFLGIGQAEVLGGRYVAKEACAVGGGGGGSDGGDEVVVCRGDVGYQGPRT